MKKAFNWRRSDIADPLITMIIKTSPLNDLKTTSSNSILCLFVRKRVILFVLLDINSMFSLQWLKK